RRTLRHPRDRPPTRYRRRLSRLRGRAALRRGCRGRSRRGGEGLRGPSTGRARRLSRRLALSRLLVRDLAQLVTPAGRHAPLRGGALGEVEVIEDAFVLCTDERIESVGRMQDLPVLDGDVAEIDGRGRCAIPGLVDCHTHACFAGDRVAEFSLRAGGTTYE